MIELLLAAQAAVAAIRTGCELLSEGKAQIGKIKKAVDDAQAIAKDAKSLWNIVKSFFSGKRKPAAAVSPVEAPKPAPAKPRKKGKEPELSYEEYRTRAIHEVCEQLKTFFEIQRQLKAHCRELEEQSKTTDKVEDSALDRVEIELQLEAMSVQIREAMVYAPQELQDIYSRFLKMYDQILEEQEFARRVKRREEREERWQREALHNHRVDRLMAVLATTVLLLWMWGLLLSLGWLVRTPSGSSLP